MSWFVLYAISIVIVPVVFAAAWCNRSEDSHCFTIEGGEAAVGLALFCLFWPIFISVTLGRHCAVKNKEARRERKMEIMRRWRLDGIIHDRSEVINTPEADLKFLLKNYRRGRIELDRKTAEIIRDELLNRNMERNLLK